MRGATTTMRTGAVGVLALALLATGCDVLLPSAARPPTIWGHVTLDGKAQPRWPVYVNGMCVRTALEGGWELLHNFGGKLGAGDTIEAVRAVPATGTTVAPASYLDVVAPAGELDFRYTTIPGEVAVPPTTCPRVWP